MKNTVHEMPMKAQPSGQVYIRLPSGTLVSSARQEKKKLRMTGRQFKKHRKKLQREGFGVGKQNKFGNTVHEL